MREHAFTRGRMVLAAAAAIGVLAMATASASATVLYSWENSLDGFASGFTTSFSTTTGVTEGSYAVGVDVPAGWSNNILQGPYTSDITPTLAANHVLSVDVTLPTAPPPGGAQLQVWFLIQGANYPSTQSTAVAITTAGTTTVTYDYSGVVPDGDTGWSNIWILTNAAPSTLYTDPGVIYFDNLQATGGTPEPASLSLLGLGGLAMLKRRRRG